MTRYPVKHMKMQSGEEVIAEIVQEMHAKDSEGNKRVVELVCRRALVIEGQLYDDFTRTYTMRPWLLYQDGPDQLITVNPNNISAVGLPSVNMAHQYYTTLSNTSPLFFAREVHGEVTEEDVNKVLSKYEAICEDLSSIDTNVIVDSDYASNVVMFTPNDSLH